MIESTDVKDFLSSPTAKEYDKVTVKEWFERGANTRFYVDVADMITKTVFGVPAARMSFLYFLVYIKSGGSLDDVLESTNTGAQGMKIVGGTQQISQKLGDLVGWDRIYLNQALLKLKLLNENDDETSVEAIVQNTFDETKVLEKLNSVILFIFRYRK